MWNSMCYDHKSESGQGSLSRASSPDYEAIEESTASRYDSPESGVVFELTESPVNTASLNRKPLLLSKLSEDEKLAHRSELETQTAEKHDVNLWQVMEGAKQILNSSDPYKYLTKSKDRRLSVQLDSNPRLLYDSAMEEGRSSAMDSVTNDKSTRQRSEYGSGIIGRPKSATSIKSPYADADGVQLRGDKGSARRKCSAQSEKMLPKPIDSWKRHFYVSYTPRDRTTNFCGHRRTSSQTAFKQRKSNQLPHLNYKIPEKLAKEKELPTKLSPSQVEEPIKRQYHKPWDITKIPKPPRKITSHVDIFYEKFLPSNEWLEMKPKKYTRNYRHGNHFEARVLKDRIEEPPPLKKEAFVWENEFQIWLMEKRLKRV